MAVDRATSKEAPEGVIELSATGSRGGAAGGGRGGRAARAARRDPGREAGTSTGGQWAVGFVVRLLAGWALAIGVLVLVPDIERWAVTNTVGAVAGALRIGSLDPTVTGATIQLGSMALRIIPECTPVMPGLLLAIAMAAYPGPIGWKLAGIAAGVASLWIFNLVRMLVLTATLFWWPASFKFMHVYLWQSITLLVVSALFLAWLRFEPPRRAVT